MASKLVCKLCGNSVYVWGSNSSLYYKHSTGRKLLWPHSPEPVTRAVYEEDYKRGQEVRNRKMVRALNQSQQTKD